ncbi:DNA damage-binding protein 1a [Coemansia spiralis]|uniref:DNA damage-binding protein 1a n=1 Tax=Coemansia spiralis TaxID=417178 RepID=A0A9W8GJE8_9FUNG|nr:DNA damage-binding protein 1a [Coemansia spiralis]
MSREAAHYKFAVLSWDATKQTILTESSGTIIEHTGRPTTETRLVSIDYESRLVIVYAYQGMVHLFPLVGAPSDSVWRSLVRITGSDKLSGSLLEDEDDDDDDDEGHFPYVVQEQLVGGLRIPSYLQPDDDDDDDEFQVPSLGGSLNKGKMVAHVVRSSDMYPALTRYIRELKVIDLRFIRHGGSSSKLPAFAVLYEDANMARQIHVYTIDETVGEMRPMSLWTSDHVEQSSNMIVPLLRGALLVVSEETLTVIAAKRAPLAISKRASTATAFEWVDLRTLERLLLADDSGTLSLIVFEYDRSGYVKNFVIERLGFTPMVSALSYMGNGWLYVGSHCGDNSVVRLHTEPHGEEAEPCDIDDVLAYPLGSSGAVAERPGTFIEVVESFPNLSPVVDLCMVGVGGNDLAGGGTSGNCGSIVACTGQRTTPALRLVRNGVGVENVADIGVSSVVNVWSLTAEISGSVADDSEELTRQVVIVLGLVGCTRVMGWTEPSSGDSVELEELSVSDAGESWRFNEPTLVAGLTRDGQYVVQVTPSGVVMLQLTSTGWRRCAEWKPSDRSVAISAASICGNRIAVAIGGSLVAYLEVRGATIELVAQQQLSHAVSCIDVYAWNGDQKSAYVAVGLWVSNDVVLLALPSLAPALTINAGKGLSRSVLMCSLGGTPYVLVGGGDGRLQHYSMMLGDHLEVSERKYVHLGSRPLALSRFSNHGEASVFAASDHSAVLFAHRPADGLGRLMCANVDAQNIRCATAVQSSMFPDDALLLLVTESKLTLARADPAQRLHVSLRPLPPLAAPHRLAYNAALAVYGVATIHPVDDEAQDLAPWKSEVNELSTRSPPSDVARFTVFGGDSGGAQPADILDSLLLQPFEMPESLCVATLTSMPRPTSRVDRRDSQRAPLEDVFLLGTSTVLPGEDDAKRGRVLVLVWDAASATISVEGSFAGLGAVYSLLPFRGMVLATIGSRLLLLGWQSVVGGSEYELVPLCSEITQIAALSVAVNGDYIIVGDVMTSVSVYHCEETVSNAGLVRRHLVPVARDYAGVWTTAVAAVPPPLSTERLYPDMIDEETGIGGRVPLPLYSQVFGDGGRQERFLVADAFNNIFRVSLSRAAEPRLLVEGRWHLGDLVNVIRPGSLVMDLADPEFPDVFRANMVFGTVLGAIGVIASVEDGRIGRILDRLQTNMAHLLPTPGLWDYDKWRAHVCERRSTRGFGFLDGDLIERFLDLSGEMQRLVFEGGGALVDAKRREAAERIKKAEYWTGHSRTEAESEAVVLGQMAVSDISAREEGVTLDYVVRLVECLTRLH